jgi:hypothetical protein
MKIVKIIFIIDILILNAVIVFLFYNFHLINQTLIKIGETPQKNVSSQQSQQDQNTVCSDQCKSYIDSKIAAISIVPNKEIVNPTIEVIKTIQPTKAKIRSVQYMPIPGSGNTLETKWTDISTTDFYLTKSDYPGIKEIYFESNIRLFNGNGFGYIRLFDVTHGVAIQGSEISTSSQKSTFVSSGKLNLYDGYNLYRIQAKSLTTDTTYFDSGRLKIIVEN